MISIYVLMVNQQHGIQKQTITSFVRAVVSGLGDFWHNTKKGLGNQTASHRGILIKQKIQIIP